jgi:hypothetical protein
MKRTLKMVKEELKSLGLYMESVPKWYRSRKEKGMKQFYVRGGGSVRWMGSDGESNSSPRVCVRIHVKSVSEITLDLIRSEYAKQHFRSHENNNIDTALAQAKIEQEEQDKEDAIRIAKNEAEAKAKAERLSTKASSETITNRKAMVSNRFAEGFSSRDKSLTFFAHSHVGAILADSYRFEFTTLIQNTSVLSMAMDLCTLQYLDLNEMMLRLNKRANDLKIPHQSLGGVTSALKYLCQDFTDDSMND